MFDVIKACFAKKDKITYYRLALIAVVAQLVEHVIGNDEVDSSILSNGSMYNIFCFGDSITYGEFDEKAGGWADRLKQYGFSIFTREKEIKVTNLGISGERSDEVLARIEREVEPRFDKDLKNVFMFAYGANDNCFFPAENRYATSHEEFKNNLVKMCEIAKKFDARVLFLGITPVIESKNATPNHRGKVLNNTLVSEYSKIIEETAQEQGATYIDIVSKYPADESLFNTDGLHPNAKGHELMYQIVKESLPFLK